jgi:hypothetical protein
LYAPRRYHYKPIGDAHGYGKLSRFLSQEVRALMRRREPAPVCEAPAASSASVLSPALDHLWA